MCILQQRCQNHLGPQAISSVGPVHGLDEWYVDGPASQIRPKDLPTPLPLCAGSSTHSTYNSQVGTVLHAAPVWGWSRMHATCSVYSGQSRTHAACDTCLEVVEEGAAHSMGPRLTGVGVACDPEWLGQVPCVVQGWSSTCHIQHVVQLWTQESHL